MQFSADELRDIFLKEGAGDIGFVEVGRKELSQELKDILRVYPETRTLVSVIKALNRESVQSQSVNIANEEFHRACDELSDICRKILRRLNSLGIRGIYTTYAFPSDLNRWPGKIWDISHKLIAIEAGLGHMGLNRLIIHPVYGNFLVLTTMLIDAEIDSYGQPLKNNPCIKCDLCIPVCPVGAISKDDKFDFMACFTHSYREALSGFQDWVEQMVSARTVGSYRSSFRDSETISIWQTLTFGYGYKCSYCMAVCPAGNNVKGKYIKQKDEYIKKTVTPLINKKEPVYVLAGSHAETVVKRNQNKEARYVRSPIRPTSVPNFLLGVRLAFNPEKAKGVRMAIRFVFTGKEEVTATVIIDGGKVDILEGIFGKTDLIVYADSESWIRFLNKEISLFRAILSRKLRIRGNPLLLKKFQDCLLIF